MKKSDIDGLTRTQRYRLNDIEAYRKLKREYACTPKERRKRTEYMRGWRERNRERHNASARKSAEKNKHKHKRRTSDYHLKLRFGISLAEKEGMVSAQDGKCLICCETFKSSRLTHVDHCHKTGKLRGILCHSCNTKLGWYERHADSIANYVRLP